MKYLDEKNALVLLPISKKNFNLIDRALSEIDSGMHGDKKGCISDLIKINKKSRHSKRSWGRLRAGRKQDLSIDFRFVFFDEQTDLNRCFNRWNAAAHGTSQPPMILFHFERVSGRPPDKGLEPPEGAYVKSRRTFSIPIQFIIKNWGSVEKGHMVYEHNISPMDFADPQFESVSYIGMTSRNWQTRYKEHQRDALTGSELLFHTSLRKALSVDSLVQNVRGDFDLVRKGIFLCSELEYVNLSYEEAMQIEEKFVERTLYPKGLNMIPGGFSGIKFLHQLGYLNRSDRVSVDDRDQASAKYLLNSENGPRIAPWVKEKWSDDEFYEKVILKRSNTLNREQILAIRKYGNEWGFDAEIIANLVEANTRQVRDVLRGKYYSRVN